MIDFPHFLDLTNALGASAAFFWAEQVSYLLTYAFLDTTPQEYAAPRNESLFASFSSEKEDSVLF
jgi:hypothetical protein